MIGRPCDNDEHSYLFLNLDLSKSMDIELSVKEHIKTLQHHIKANILADVGRKVSVPHFSTSLILPTHRLSFLSQALLVLSNLYSLQRQGNRSLPSRRTSLNTVLPPTIQQTTCFHYLLAPLSSFRSVSLLSSQWKKRLNWPPCSDY